jgi:hypothetical protein
LTTADLGDTGPLLDDGGLGHDESLYRRLASEALDDDVRHVRPAAEPVADKLFIAAAVCDSDMRPGRRFQHPES